MTLKPAHAIVANNLLVALKKACESFRIKFQARNADRWIHRNARPDAYETHATVETIDDASPGEAPWT